MLDLLRYPHAGAGIDNIATVISDLGSKVDPHKLAALSVVFERTIVQRLGYLLDKLSFGDRTEALREMLSQYRYLPWTELEPARTPARALKPEPLERNKRWHVIVNRMPEIDE